MPIPIFVQYSIIFSSFDCVLLSSCTISSSVISPSEITRNATCSIVLTFANLIAVTAKSFLTKQPRVISASMEASVRRS